MKRAAVLVLMIHYITISDSRLVKKVTADKPAPVTSTSATMVRVRRFTEDDSAGSSSKYEQSDETPVHENTTNHLSNNLTRSAKTRVTRNSNATTIDKSKFHPANEIKVLVKKPIPKFSELDDYDVEPKIYRILPRFIESDEVEDEDFNVDDYDFDLKHDEFVGRGKPSIPRLREKEKSHEPAPEPNAASVTLPPKDEQILPNTFKAPVTIKQRRDKAVERPREKKDDFYDYEITTKTNGKEKGEECSDEVDESKEYSRSTARRVRSPWHEIMLPAKLHPRSMAAAPKRMAVLTMFPIAKPSYQKQEE